MPQSGKIGQLEEALGLFRYLTKLAEMRNSSTDDIKAYPKVMWLRDIPGNAVRISKMGALIKIPRVKVTPHPPLPQQCQGWVSETALNNPSKTPDLKEKALLQAVRAGSDGQETKMSVEALLEDNPTVTEAWAQYLPSWEEWALEAGKQKPAKNLYNELFSMNEQVKGSPEQLETVLGIGLLNWKDKDREIHRHLLTIKVEISYQAANGALTVNVSPGAKIELEEDMLSASLIPSRAEISPYFENLDSDEFDIEKIHQALEVWVNSAHSEGVYSREMTADLKSFDVPRLVYAPALIIRKRTHRSLLRMYQEISKNLAESGWVPESILDLVGVNDKQEKSTPSTDRILFPLPANDEQRAIVERLSKARGVVVQGPPGTGKSQTIANLISHLLANGQRVLVTSQTDRALEVLKEKLPRGVKDLCVSVVGAGKDGARDLERSLGALDREFSDGGWREKYQKKVVTLEAQLQALEEMRVALISKLASETKDQTIEHDIYGFKGRPSDIALQLQEKARYGWITESVKGVDVTNEEAQELRMLLKANTSHIRAEAAKSLPRKAVTVEAFAKTLELARECKGEASELTKKLSYIPERTLGIIVSLASELQGAKELGTELGRMMLIKESVEEALGLLSDTRALDVEEMTLPPVSSSILIRQGGILVERLKSGGQLKKGTFFFKDKEVKEFLKIKLGGMEVNDLESAQRVLGRLKILESLTFVEKQVGRTVMGSSFSLAKMEMERIKETIEESFSIENSRRELRSVLSDALGIKDSSLADSPYINELLEAARSVLDMQASEKARSDLAEWRHSWQEAARGTNPAQACISALKAFDTGDVQLYSQALQEANETLTLRAALARENQLFESMYQQAPWTARQLKESPWDQGWDNKLQDFEEACRWNLANQWLESANSYNSSNLDEELKRIEESISKTTGELVVAKAWLAAMARMTPIELQHLRAYHGALRRLGKASGKNANTEKQNAQRHMEAAQNAVPAWVMPIYRVAETMKPQLHAFDVVIVDEASQAGVEALFLMWLAKKIVVVGDDKQISPDTVGVSSDAIDMYQRQFLSGISMADSLSARSSLFDQASVRYQGRITLTEHFRCMPEIISFSNKLMYDSRLKPLKQYSAKRLTPLKHTYVPTEKGGGRVNKDEAETLALAIAAAVEDPAYEGKTMGVVSLLGTMQANYIESLLLELIGAEEMQKRKLRCSDAPGFQGDERDVIFASMVVTAPKEGKLKALGEFKYFQRFNVAASRAQEQFWLFHSVNLEDLNPQCPRALLLAHVSEKTTREEAGRIEGVKRNVRHERFDSLFEQNVYLDLMEKGYQVVPQWEVLGRRIDLVVIGQDSKIALECDGDTWHGLERFQEDLNRQRDLERVGWKFIRLRASEYTYNKEESMARLESSLEDEGIKPLRS